MAYGYSANYARSGYRDERGRLEVDYDAPRNWGHPHWQARSEDAHKAIGALSETLPAAACDALDAFWEQIPDAWMNATAWRYLALGAEMLLAYLRECVKLNITPAVDDMLTAYRKAQPVHPAVLA